MKVVDMHCDTIARIYEIRNQGEETGLGKNNLHLDLEKMQKGDYGLQNFALFVSLEREKRPFEYAMKLVDTFYGEMEKHQDWISPVTSYEDLERNVGFAYHRGRRSLSGESGLSEEFLPSGRAHDDSHLELSQ